MSDKKGGARHSKNDVQKIQAIFNFAAELGAICPNCLGGSPKKATFSDMESRVFAAFWEMLESVDAEYSGGFWPFALYNDALIVRTRDGRYVAYRYIDTDDMILFGSPYNVDMMFVPTTDSQSVADEVPGAIKTAEQAEDTPDNATGDSPQDSGGEPSPDTPIPAEPVETETKSANYPYFDNSLRVIRRDDETITVGNYVLTYGKPDLEGHGSNRVNPDGTKGEYFTADTKWTSPYTDSGKIHVDWEHGEDVDAPELAGEHGILGYADMSTAKSDERGLFLERVLTRRNKYVEWLTALIEAGKVGTSSQAIRGRTKRADDGFIEQWPLYRDSLTVNPMQWENVGELPSHVIESLKALAAASPALANDLKAAGLFAGANGEPEKTDNDSGGEHDRNRVSAEIEIEGDLINISEKIGE